MKGINLRKFQCLNCGSEKLEKIADGMYECVACGKKWKEEDLQKFQDILHVELDNLRLDTAQDMLNIAGSISSDIRGIVNTAEAARKLEAVSNLKKQLYKATAEEYISNTKVKEICDKILEYFPEDFYANFYLATCQKDKTSLGEFLQNVDVEERFADISMMLDYLIKGLNPGWTMAVGNFIERIKKIDTEIFNKYRTAFEEVNAKIEDSVFDPAIPRDVFVAYSSADMPKVEKLVCALEDEELTCFVAARNLRHGSGAVENYKNAIHTAIDHCSVLVFVSSQNSRHKLCDAYELELQYIEKNRKNMPRVEYLTGDYIGKVIERYFKEFFSGLEYCTSVQQTVERVYDYIMNAEDVPVKTTGQPKAKEVSVSDDTEESRKTSIPRKLIRVIRLIESGEFDKAQTLISEFEKEETARSGDCEISEFYHCKMLLEFKARNDDALISTLTNAAFNNELIAIEENEYFNSAQTCAIYENNDKELEKLRNIKEQANNGIEQAKKTAAQREEQRKEEARKAEIKKLLKQADNALTKKDYAKTIELYSQAIALGSHEAEEKKATAEALQEESATVKLDARCDCGSNQFKVISKGMYECKSCGKRFFFKDLKLKRVRCQYCGSDILDEISKDIYRCSSCGKEYILINSKLQKFECLRCGRNLELNGEETFKCKSCGYTFKKSNFLAPYKKTKDDEINDDNEINEQGTNLEEIAILRQRLWTEINNTYINSTEIIKIAREIKKYLPDDYFANFCEIANSGNDKQVNAFLKKTSKENMAEYGDVVIDFMIKSLKSSNITAVSQFIEKAFKGDPDYDKYTTALEREAEKVNHGIYELTLTRDVFLAYSSADMEKVIELCDFLESNGITCFLASRNLRHGRGAVDNYAAALKQAMDNCKSVVFISSTNSRNFACDAYRELSYIERNLSDMPRVEYLVDNYTGKAAERYFKKFFSGLKYYTSKEAVESRIFSYLTEVHEASAEKEARKAEEERKRKAEEDRKAEEERKRKIREYDEIATKVKELLSILGDYSDIGGGYVTFGTYPQSKKAENVKIGLLVDRELGYYLGSDSCLYAECNGNYYKVEPIKWKVLHRGSEMSVVADNILDAHRFAESSNNYANSEIRKFINGEFYNKAFSDSQKAKIVIVTVDNSLSSTGDNNNKYICGNTKDKVFLLSKKEAEWYFNSNEVRKRIPTEYAIARGTWQYSGNVNSYKLNGKGCGWWWLRSPYYNGSNYAQFVLYDGCILDANVSGADNGVLPALQFKL